jgi:hypothetical protein
LNNEKSIRKTLIQELDELIVKTKDFDPKENINIESSFFYVEKIEEDYDQAKGIISNLSRQLSLEKLELASNIEQSLIKIEENLVEIEKELNEIKTKKLIEETITSENVRKELLEKIRKIEEISRENRNKCEDLNFLIRNITSKFIGRKKEEINKLREQIRNLKSYFNNISETCSQLYDEIEGKQLWKGRIETFDLLMTLYRGKELWSHNLLTKLTGLRNIAGDQYVEEVTLEAPFLSSEEINIPIDELFMRYPPFEPIQIEYKGIIGRFIWFIQPRNAIIMLPEIKNTMEKMIKIEKDSLVSVIPIDLFSNNVDKPEIFVKINLGRSKGIIFVKYGSKKLYNLYSKICGKQAECTKEHIKKIQENYEKTTGKRYSVFNLGYVWFCTLGRGMSTDPFDIKCPFMKNCPVGRSIERSKDKCDKWSWSRRLFPKVFVVPKRELYFASDGPSYEEALVFIEPFKAKGVRLYEIYEKLQWNMPSAITEGPVVEIDLETPVKKHLPRTNIIGFTIPLSMIKAILKSLIDEDIPNKPEIIVANKDMKAGLNKILLSKFYVYKETKKGLDTYTFLQKRDKEIIENFKKFYSAFIKNKEEQEEYMEFLLNMLAHTLAHFFVTYVSNSLEIEPSNLLYVYKVNSKEDKLIVAIAENSAWGSLDIVNHVNSKFGSISRLIDEFINNTLNSLEKHNKDVLMFTERRIPEKREENFQQMKKVIDKVKERYDNFINNGIIIDTATFLNNYVLSEEDYKLMKELKEQGVDIDIRTLRELIVDAIVASGINVCIDGCTACVILERGCTSPVLQNLLLSRNLAERVLKVLTGREQLKGKGKELGLVIFNQAKESFFAFSPYLDEEGVEFLQKLASRNVKVTLITRKENAKLYGEKLRSTGIDVYTLKPELQRHDKFYIIDRRILVSTSQNLSRLSSINDFQLKRIDVSEAERIIRQEIGAT